MIVVPHDLTGLNAAPAADLEKALLGCCAAQRWATAVTAGRPYGSAAELYDAADAALNELDEAEIDAALAGHPRIGAQPDAGHSPSSGREQSGVSSSSAATLAALAEGNREYEARFGHVYLVCADGRRGEELLAVLHRRLHNDPLTERATVRAELRKINRIRLGRLIGVAG
jgi:2-oxo-4-hydroxy-4-carboxy-5-ureidoimidazoline decarboxylase